MTMLMHRVLWPCVSVVALTAVAFAHKGDPKGRYVNKPYDGPSYRAGEGGIAGGPSFDSQGVTMLAMITLGEFSDFNELNHTDANDCWGYVSPSGREYALMGLQNGTGFVEITDPTNPVILDVYQGPGSTWRDMKVYQTYAYAVSEAGEGIQVFDLSDIDNGTVTQLQNVTTGGTEATHNVALDEASGYLYRCGGGPNGLRIYDLSNPASPTWVGEWQDHYVHDAQVVTYTSGEYAGREIAFCNIGSAGGLSIVDVTDKSNTFTVGEMTHTNPGYSHQGWLSEDRQYFFMNDETNGTDSWMYVIDVSDLENPFEATIYSNGVAAATHNHYTRGNLVFGANYNSGLRVFDATDALNPVEVAFFDTGAGSGHSYSNLWSNYPLFPSGTVIGSDRQYGLFVWRVGDPTLTFDYPQGLPTVLDPDGQSFQVQITENEGSYVADTAMLHYDQGDGYTSVPMTSLGGLLFEASFSNLECPGQVSYYISAQSDDGVVWRDPVGAPTSAYSADIDAVSEIAYQDDMETDTGWSVVDSGGLTAGTWDRGVPVDCNRGDPPADADGSGQAWLTWNSDNGGDCNTDVDDGETTLTSPQLDATSDGGGVPTLVYQRWYSNDFGGSPNADSMPVEISNDNGSTWVLLEEVTGNANQWVTRSFVIEDFVTPTDQIRVRFRASDLGEGSVVEAGVDDLRIEMQDCGGDEPDPCPTDLTGDGETAVDDLIAIIVAWGTDDAAADIDGDGTVGVNDLTLVILNWGACP